MPARLHNWERRGGESREQHTLDVARLVIGLLATVIVLGFAAKRILWLTKLISSSGQKLGDERGRKDDLPAAS